MIVKINNRKSNTKDQKKKKKSEEVKKCQMTKIIVSTKIY